jgi:hypothetical protein
LGVGTIGATKKKTMAERIKTLTPLLMASLA